MNTLPFNRWLLEYAADNRRRMSPAEVRIWQRLRRKQIMQYDFDRQKPILSYIVDFYCKEAGLVIEIDGNSHNDDDQPKRDRQSQIEALGIWFLRCSNQESYLHTDLVVQAIMTALQAWEEQNGVPEIIRKRREKWGSI